MVDLIGNLEDFLRVFRGLFLFIPIVPQSLVWLPKLVSAVAETTQSLTSASSVTTMTIGSLLIASITPFDKELRLKLDAALGQNCLELSIIVFITAIVASKLADPVGDQRGIRSNR